MPERPTSAGGSLAAGTFAPASRAVLGPNDKYDLVIKGGDVLDPSQGLRGRRVVGIKNGVVEAISAEIPAALALRVLDARGRTDARRPHRGTWT
jgi:dihydroorotase